MKYILVRLTTPIQVLSLFLLFFNARYEHAQSREGSGVFERAILLEMGGHRIAAFVLNTIARAFVFFFCF